MLTLDVEIQGAFQKETDKNRVKNNTNYVFIVS